MDIKINALVISKKDSVAVAIDELKSGDVATFKIGEEVSTVNIIQDIPIYHKFAIVDVEKDSLVYKYGKSIGKALSNIKRGQHIHTHNLVSIREGIEE